MNILVFQTSRKQAYSFPVLARFCNGLLLYVVDKLTFEGVGVVILNNNILQEQNYIYAHDYCRCSVNRKKVCWTDTYARTEENNFYCMEAIHYKPFIHAYTK